MLGDNIKRIRESIGLGLNEAARLANISGSYLSNIEKNIKKNPSAKTLNRIAEALHVSVDDLFKENTDNTSASTEDKAIEFSDDEKLLLEKIKALPKEDAKKILKMIEIFEEENKDK